ncbi:hypothetical protein BACCAP_03624 [Pseudoflavonifractor capillosus ATCC 29799]|uniref:Uncharacterized protein n=1 Tax=Pseudoflavonifractor capillosus ATCC 29799 TaxID=411467 RepID=A6NZH3_9FIRM|nr:hypothetical protein BACCAP_03624 [Pseudoflavonifractor capillosus ATCC 29799]
MIRKILLLSQGTVGEFFLYKQINLGKGLTIISNTDIIQ